MEADSFDEAFEKAEKYMENDVCDYTNTNGENVKTFKIEAVNCFLSFDSEGDV